MSYAVTPAGEGGFCRLMKHQAVQSLAWAAGCSASLAFLWLVGVYIIANNPTTKTFVKFGLLPTLEAFPELWGAGKIQNALAASGFRLGSGLLMAIVIGVPIGILMGRIKWFRDFTNSPFQFVRMISPLSWMPLVVLVFVSWFGSFFFLFVFVV